MPNTREKLIELLDGVQDYGFCRSTVEEPQCRVINSIIADNLIANGVTVQKWSPVSERLPENYQYALCIMQEDGDFRVLRWNYIDYMWNTGIEWFREKDVTHWMPLPEPPKTSE